MKRAALAITALLTLPGLAAGQATDAPARDGAAIEVVFVLDTTGSMGGLIEGAKQKIWSIANAMATAEPRPGVRMGLLAYRDRGDEYITKLTPLTDDLDGVYSALMSLSAGGGGDWPESVNQALREAISLPDWTADDSTLRLVYLVGDAPPKDYDDDVKFPETCALAAERGIIINAIQCGSAADTREVWQRIARSAEGEYFAIDQSGGMHAVATPFDEELARLGRELEGTVLGYGRADQQATQARRFERADAIAAAAPEEALAARAVYKSRFADDAALLGDRELVRDVAAGLDLGTLSEEELPERMRGMNPEERAAFVAGLQAERDRLQNRIKDLGRQRDEYIARELAAAGPDSFDARVVESLRRQGARKGIVYGTK